jgi:hypothetical protein
VGSTATKLGIGFLGDSANQMGRTLIGNISPFINVPALEPSPFTNWWNTLPLSRGWDYEIGNVALKTKGTILQGVLGTSLMKASIDRLSPDNLILTPAILSKIIKDPECAAYIWNRGGLVEYITL